MEYLMKRDFNPISDKILILIAFIGTLFVLSPYLPLGYDMPGRDSGVFIYVGEQILDGRLPYLDVWDHKGPLLYYINAFGILLGFHSLYGLWAIQFIFISLSALVSLHLLKLSFGKIPAIAGTFFWLLNLHILIEGGNLTEMYALLFQFLAILFFLLSERRNSLKYMFLVGIFIGLCVALKPNILGIAIAAIIFSGLKGITIKDYYYPLKSTVILIIGGILPLFVFLVYFITNGVAYDFIDQYIRYNLIYSSTPIYLKLKSIYYAFDLIYGIMFVIGAWILTLTITAAHCNTKSMRDFIKNYPLIIFSGILLPLDLILASSGGRNYGHYYMTLLPVLSILFATLIWYIFKCFKSEYKIKLMNYCLDGVKILVIVILLPMVLYFFITTSFSVAGNIYSQNHDEHEIVSYIKENSLVSDTVLFWGAETSLNVMSNRNAPTRYVYQYPLFTHGYAKQSMMDEFLQDLKSTPPKYIIDTSSTNSIVIPINQSKRIEWSPSNPNYVSNINFEDYFSFIEDYYYPLNNVSNECHWTVYVLNNSTNTSG
jgi:hypothetical protein